jgi:(1->4)-alpha-D-glucan 1-alpha-D-glucosylmutase
VQRPSATRLGPGPRPSSTYRLQLRPGFGFREAAEVVPYLASLGVSHVYLSPPFTASPGSAHGYDVTDHNTLSPELGGDDGWAALQTALRAHHLGAIVDFVPNHMGIGAANAWWMDLLENGPASVYAPFFDVDWHPVKDELANKVLVPVLGDQFGEVLERGELRLVREGGHFFIGYFEHRFPIAPRQVPKILLHRIEELRAVGTDDPGVMELESVIASLEKLAPRGDVEPDAVAERAREKEVAKRRLAALFDVDGRIRAHVDETVRTFNGTPGDPRSFDLLEDLLLHQAYRLAYWRVAGEEINYRRFFDVNGLAAIRMEDERVFDETHRLLFKLVREGQIDGLRIDHPDGLYSPPRYFRRLQERFVAEQLESREAVASYLAVEPRPLYVVVEKILEGRERMPAGWAVDGTTGYDFLAAANGVFVARGSERELTNLYARFIGERLSFADVVRERKKLLMRSAMASEVNMLAHQLSRIAERDRRTRDFTRNELGRALVELIASLSIYRTYIEGEAPRDVDARDRRYVEDAIALARRFSPTLNESLFRFLADVILLRHPEGASEEDRHARVELVRKLQQVTGPVTAKSIEDSAFYVYHRLVSLNEVGGDPSELGAPPAELHRIAAERLAIWPGSMNATSTHDTKRSEDVRLRISALSEIPGEWGAAVRGWARVARPWKKMIDGRLAPERNDEYLFYQTLVGAWPDDGDEPDFDERIQAYMLKALREAKARTSWVSPNEAYEEAVRAFVGRALASSQLREAMAPLARRAAAAARISSLAQVALKIAMPGVADVYQGTELWDLSLVDPDNRRPVDFERRARLLAQLDERVAIDRAGTAREVAAPDALRGGEAKLLLVAEGLRLRRADPGLFARGEHIPLAARGRDAEHVIAFVRRRGGRALVCVAPRLVLSKSAGWEGELELPGRWTLTCAVSGQEVPIRRGRIALADAFAGFPAALLRSW